MFSDKKLKAFIPTIKPAESKSFYKDVLGLKLNSEDKYALEFDANGTRLRVTTVKDFKPHPFTVLGWDVDDIISTIKSLNKKKIFCEKYDFLEQDEFGIWTAPEGQRLPGSKIRTEIFFRFQNKPIPDKFKLAYIDYLKP